MAVVVAYPHLYTTFVAASLSLLLADCTVEVLVRLAVSVVILAVAGLGNIDADPYRADLPLAAIHGGSCAGAGHAHIAHRACIPVVAGRGVVRAHAPGDRIAGVIGAGIVVVAVGRRAARAAPVRAGVAGRARATVVAGRGVVRAHAPGDRIADVIGAGVAVVAVRRRAARAAPVRAGVVGRARVPVVAGRGVVRAHAPGDRIAGVIGAGVLIVTSCVVRQERAAIGGVTGIPCAVDPIVAG